MQEHHAFDVDQANPFSPRELLYSLGVATVWVVLSATLVLVLTVRSV
ncbi:hypothetical protein [Rhodoferax sp. U11-2br]|nr:hypothetical protein [Rhodoferax sp. U11-2br]MBT3065586.1 hypothetical protein [Rhodoferax sp. U11-2br]